MKKSHSYGTFADRDVADRLNLIKVKEKLKTGEYVFQQSSKNPDLLYVLDTLNMFRLVKEAHFVVQTKQLHYKDDWIKIRNDEMIDIKEPYEPNEKYQLGRN